MNLLERQAVFHLEITSDDVGLPPTSVGMEIYRTAYRNRLLATLGESFERTRRWVGEEAFMASACHFILCHPPKCWSLDDYGANYPEVLASLFKHEPEVAELAWLEWQMLRAFAAPDLPKLEPAALARIGYSEADWANMSFSMAAGFATTCVSTECTLLWESLAEGRTDLSKGIGRTDAGLLVWRSGLSPTYRLTSLDELIALNSIAAGASLATVAECCDENSLGDWLVCWLRDGIFSGAAPSTQCVSSD